MNVGRLRARADRHRLDDRARAGGGGVARRAACASSATASTSNRSATGAATSSRRSTIRWSCSRRTTTACRRTSRARSATAGSTAGARATRRASWRRRSRRSSGCAQRERRGSGCCSSSARSAGSDGADVANANPIGSQFLINGEPTDSRLALATRGNLRVRLRATGRAAHSATPEHGVSAIDKLLDALMQLRTLELPGGSRSRTDLLQHRADRRWRRPERHLAARLGRGDVPDRSGRPSRCWRCSAQLKPLVEIEEVLRVPHVRLKTWADTTDARPPSFPFTTDIPLLSSAWGTPLLFGPGSFLVAHTAEEHLDLAELEAAVGTYVELAQSCLTGRGRPLAPWLLTPQQARRVLCWDDFRGQDLRLLLREGPCGPSRLRSCSGDDAEPSKRTQRERPKPGRPNAFRAFSFSDAMTMLFPTFLKLDGRRGPARRRRSGRRRQAARPARRGRGGDGRGAGRSCRRLPRAPVDDGAAAVPFRPISTASSFVVAAAPPDVNREVAAAAHARGLFVNAVDDVESASAYAGAVFRRAGVTIAISTDGEAPALAGLVREALEALLPEELDRWMECAREARQQWLDATVSRWPSAGRCCSTR